MFSLIPRPEGLRSLLLLLIVDIALFKAFNDFTFIMPSSVLPYDLYSLDLRAAYWLISRLALISLLFLIKVIAPLENSPPVFDLCTILFLFLVLLLIEYIILFRF